MNILITGACGYVGSSLTPYLLKKQHNIRAIDTQWFGKNLQKHPNLEIIKLDIRDLEAKHLDSVDSVIHLANIANDPGVELNPTLSWEVNVLETQRIVDLASKLGVRQFIYASSGSVYGVKDEPEVTEDLGLLPISVYNKTKMVSERVALSYKDSMKIHNIRPATVCGWSPRMRLDVSVNMLTFQALKNKQITVFGGQQIRPNIHIQDMIRVYSHFIENEPNIQSGNYNAGFENISIMDIAKMVATKISAEIVVTESNDPRSYRLNSDKLLSTGFEKKFSVNDSIEELISLFNKGKIQDKDEFYTVKMMKILKL